MRIFINYSRLNLRKHFFMNRVVQMWNSLPEEVVWVPSFSVLKVHLDIHWAKIRYGHIGPNIFIMYIVNCPLIIIKIR